MMGSQISFACLKGECMNSGMYTEREVQCLKEGMGAVRSVLSGTDTEAKRRLLFLILTGIWIPITSRIFYRLKK